MLSIKQSPFINNQPKFEFIYNFIEVRGREKKKLSLRSKLKTWYIMSKIVFLSHLSTEKLILPQTVGLIGTIKFYKIDQSLKIVGNVQVGGKVIHSYTKTFQVITIKKKSYSIALRFNHIKSQGNPTILCYFSKKQVE